MSTSRLESHTCPFSEAVDSTSVLRGLIQIIAGSQVSESTHTDSLPASCSYNPYDGPNEHPEAELPLVAGKYLYVYGTMDDDGFYQGERPSSVAVSRRRISISSNRPALGG